MPSHTNPFSNLPGALPARLVGRTAPLAALDTSCRTLGLAKQADAMMVAGMAGFGVTAFLREGCNRALSNKWASSTISIDNEDPRAHFVAGFDAAISAFSQRMPGTSRLPRLQELVSAFGRTTGLLHEDIGRFLRAVGSTMLEIDRGFVVFVDNAPNLGDSIGPLAQMLHDEAERGTPATMVLGGLPFVAPGLTRIELLPLGVDQIEVLLTEATAETRINFTPDAVDLILKYSRGIPFLVQTFAEQAWNARSSDLIEATDVERCRPAAQASMRSVWYEPRIDKLSGTERRYLTALAEAGGDNVEIQFIARKLGDSNRFSNESSTLKAVRVEMMRRGVICSKDDGSVSFTLPSFPSFLDQI